MKIAHLTTVDMSLRYLVLPQLVASKQLGEAIGISAPGDYVEEVEAQGIRHIPLRASTRGIAPASDVRSIIQLWRILRAENIDILHTHNPKPGVYGRILGRLAGVPIVINTIHGLYATEESPRVKRAAVYALEWLASRFSDAELIQSPEDLDLLTRLRIVPEERTVYLGNGVDLERFNPAVALEARERLRDELGVTDEQIVVGMVGRLVAEKGVPELIEAARLLGGSCVVVVVGPFDPEKPDSLPAETIEAAKEQGVMFLGMRSDVAELYGAFDMFVLPSHREGFPRAAMEAAAAGLPVVATDIRGCRQVVEQGVNGLLFKTGDVGGLVDAIQSLVDDPEMRVRMGRESAEKAAAEFDEMKVVETVMRTYSDVARRRGLGWAIAGDVGAPTVRPASADDALTVAELHRSSIAGGFLSSLGTRFLSLLYKSMAEDPSCALFVAESDGVVVGFISGTADTRAFYRRFLRRHWARAIWSLLPSMIRPATLKKALETARYGSNEDSSTAAELLSMAVAPSARRKRLGMKLISELLDWATARSIESMKVVVGAENSGAIALYNRAGFVDGRAMKVHDDAPSEEFIWSSKQ